MRITRSSRIVSYTPGIGTTIAGNINTTPNTTVSVDLYTDTVEGLGGYGQGQTYLAAWTCHDDNDGNASFTFLSTSLATERDRLGDGDRPGKHVGVLARPGRGHPPDRRAGRAAEPGGHSRQPPLTKPRRSTSTAPARTAPTATRSPTPGISTTALRSVTTSTPTVTHSYDYDGTYVVTLIVNDGHGGIESNIDILTINKLPPTITLNPLPASLAVGTTLNLSGTIDDPTPDLETVVLDWGDGSSPTTLQLPAGSTTFSASHDYASPLPGGATTATITRHRDRRLQPGRVAAALTHRPPHAHAHIRRRRLERIDLGHADGLPASRRRSGSPSASPRSTSAARSLLSGTIVDPNPLVSHTVTIAWGDTPATTTLVLPPGDLAFSSTHQYESTPGNSLSGPYTIGVTVVNSNLLSGDATTSVTVVDVSPVVQIESLPLSTTGSLVSLIAIATEPGTLNQLTYQWTLTTNGCSLRVGDRPDPFVCLDQRRSVHRGGGGHRPGRRDRAGQRAGRHRPIDPEQHRDFQSGRRRAGHDHGQRHDLAVRSRRATGSSITRGARPTSSRPRRT